MSEACPIYLDHHAHALLDSRVAAILADAFLTFDANPHSVHLPGEAAHRAVEQARADVAALIGCGPSEIIFTSGATEANNLGLLGLVGNCAAAGRARILVGAGEHPSVLAAADHASGGHAPRIPLLSSGKIDLEALDELLGPDVGMVSVAAANHEIGTVQDLAEISDRVRRAGALFHSDLAQAAGWIDVPSDLLDLASLSAHKMGGPVGVGALFVRRRHRRHLAAQSHGGEQEHGARAGTLPGPTCIAFGAAAALVMAEREQAAVRIGALRDGLLRRLLVVGGAHINGGSDRLPGNLNISFEGVDGEALVLRLRNEVSVSTGSACTSRSLEPSHVLAAIGLGASRAQGAIRLGLGKGTTAAEVERAGDAIAAAVEALRAVGRRAA